ncbi:unnamed protein product [Nippostrongylus brasiliensis]|uniref:G_PROTEIN_RECEP_F1_2 domain-containing protein n=1 Tax=Nippostrongylus brasiliensis TaxID=27835 RepID=A0A0N4YCB3_NIPBR|nr:unnamed protein product [Nippostrongylus brasiliensis]
MFISDRDMPTYTTWVDNSRKLNKNSAMLVEKAADSVIGFWIFGTWMCKLHHVCGSVGRIVSTFLITAMSFDRYVAVCHPHHTYLRSRSFVLGVISCEFF